MRMLIVATIAASIFGAIGASADSFPAPSAPSSMAANAGNPVENTYQETATGGCSTGVCSLTFPATTHAKTLVSHVSCFFQIPSSATVFSVQLGSNTGKETNFVGIEKYDNFSGFGGYVVNAPTYLFFASGEDPTVSVVASSAPVQTLICTISGNFH